MQRGGNPARSKARQGSVAMVFSCTDRVERELRTHRRKEGRKEEKDSARETGLEVDRRAGSLARRKEAWEALSTGAREKELRW